MRPIYTSPRHENIDRVVALLAEHGIETTVANRAVYDRPSYRRFSYSAREDRSDWARVEVTRAADLTRARAILRDIGIEPLVRHAEVLEEARRTGTERRATGNPVAARVRMIAIVAVLAVFAMIVLKMLKLF